MSNMFTKIAFTDSVKAVQDLMGSRKNYARFEAGLVRNNHLTENEVEFISRRDSFYSATVSETGWPYVQHRGGPKGFVKVLSPQEIGFADFSGNRQYITVGNITKNNRIAMILMDYPNQTRLKILGTVTLVDLKENAPAVSALTPKDYPAKIERGFIIKIEGFDWNCPQHITPRWTPEEIEKAVQPLKDRIAELERRLREK